MKHFYQKRIKNFKCIDDYKGIVVCISLNTICNFKCPYCFAKTHIPAVSTFTIDEIGSIIDSITKYHQVTFIILGGEPTLYPRLNEVVNMMGNNDRCYAVELYTNGSVDIRARHPKLRVMFSMHPTELLRLGKVDEFINRVNSYDGQAVVQASLLQTTKAVRMAEAIASKINKRVVPNYIHYDEITEQLRIPSPLDDVPMYLADGVPVSYKDAQKCFAGYKCSVVGFTISPNFDVHQGCVGLIGNLKENADLFEDVTLSQVCDMPTCRSSCLMQLHKEMIDVCEGRG